MRLYTTTQDSCLISCPPWGSTFLGIESFLYFCVVHWPQRWRLEKEPGLGFSTGLFILNLIILLGKFGFPTYDVALESHIKDISCTTYVQHCMCQMKPTVKSSRRVPCGYRDKCYQLPSSDKLTSALSPHWPSDHFIHLPHSWSKIINQF